VVGQARNLGSQQWLIDGEALGDRLVAFDLLEEASADHRREPYSRRLAVLYDMLAPNGQGALRSLGTAIGTKHKKNLLKSLQERHAEGIVFKRHDAPYTSGRPASGGNQLKCKFYCTASCIVAGINKGKRSVAIELCDGQQRVAVGNVTIPAGRSIPKTGEVIEVRYLFPQRYQCQFQANS
jgi:bifunctional non-homologous end joining protein LigD